MGLFFENFLSDFLVIMAAFVAFLYWYFSRNLDYWEKRGVPYLKPQPLFGNFLEFFMSGENQCFFWQKIYNRLHPHQFGGWYAFQRINCMIRDPELVKRVLVKDFPYFQDRGFKVNPKLNPLQQDLFRLGGPIWKSLRVKLSPTFTSGKIKMMSQAIEECSRGLQKYLEKKAENEEIVEMREIFAKFTTNIIGTCAFGLQLNALESEDSEFRKMGRRLFASSFSQIMRLILNQIFPKTAEVLGVGEMDKDIEEFFMNVVKETVQYREKNNIKRNDFLQLLIEIKNKGMVEKEEGDEEDDLGFSKKEVEDLKLDDGLFVSQAFVFFIAGFETSSNAMSFALHEMAVNPDIQRRAREEIDSALRETDGKLTYDAVMSMKYLDRVVSETLRRYPPLSTLQREVSMPYKIPGTDVTLEKGVLVNIPLHALQHDPQYFPDPDRFDPERFTEENKAKRPHYVYLPFGEGPRNCIGMRFGLLQTKMGLAALLSKYEFHACERTEVPIKLKAFSIFTASINGTIVRITNRK